MGIDAMVYAEGRLTDELTGQLTDRFPDSEWEDHTNEGWTKHPGRTFIVWTSLSRYYGPGYERGDWPTIARAIETLRSVVGHVYYHGDNSGWYGDHPQHTVADTEQMWAHWRGPKWDDYYLPRPR
jgi:hypothetical protein